MPEAVSMLGQHVINSDWESFQKGVSQVKKVFRAGLYDGLFPVWSHGTVLAAYAKFAEKHFLADYERLRSRREACSALQELADKLLNKPEYKMPNIDAYLCKKVMEMIYLFGFSGVFGIKLQAERLYRMGNVWPIPKHALSSLRLVFPV